jgi:hypothetical protein
MNANVPTDFLSEQQPTDRQGMRRQLRVYWRGVRLKGETIVAEGNALGTRQKPARPEGASQNSTNTRRFFRDRF